jgi:GNAT superfamily N-acetyltransferase
LSHVRTFSLQPGMKEVATCAQWRVDAFAGVIGASFDDELASLDRFIADQRHQVALVAARDGNAAGTCLLVPSEIEPLHDVSPWLAGLFVAPEHRRHGIGQLLVRAIENEARLRGHPKLHLYTTDAVRFYEPLGWTVQDHVDWLGYPTNLMVREL